MPTLARPPGPGKKFARVSAGPWGPPRISRGSRCVATRDRLPWAHAARRPIALLLVLGAGKLGRTLRALGTGWGEGGPIARPNSARSPERRPPPAPGRRSPAMRRQQGSRSPGRGVTHPQTSILPKLRSLPPPRTPPTIANQIDLTLLSPTIPPAIVRGMDDFWRFLENRRFV